MTRTTPTASTNAVLEAAAATLTTLSSRPLTPGLHIVATPIGHLGDISLRALATLANADRIYCEDTRHSLKLLNHFAITRPLSPYHDYNAATVRPKILADLARGACLALISDAGTPLVSDPGYKLVRAVLEAGHRVIAVPGASAVLAALTMAGLPTDRFVFAGFPSPKKLARAAELQTDLERSETVIYFEAPTRLADLLSDIARLAPDRPVAVARELTKLHETLHKGTARHVAEQLAASTVLGECVVLVGPAPPAEMNDADLTTHLVAALTEHSLSEAVKRVVNATGASRNRVYDLALSVKRQHKPDPDHGNPPKT